MRINENRLLDTFVKLVSIDSPSYREREMCEELKARLENLGLDVEEDDSAVRSGSNCGNLIAKLPGTVDIPPILFSCHMDTVAPAYGKKAIIHDDGTITSAGDTILGADDLSGVSAILEALQVIQQEKIPHGPIEVVFTTCEEVYGKGVENLDMEKLAAKEAYILDLTGPTGRAAKRAPTIISFEATINGRASHAGFGPEKGIHSIQIASRAISKLQFGRIDPGTTVNIGTIHGGLATNIVPESCTVKGEVRSFNHAKALEETQRILAVFCQEAEQIGATATTSYRVCIKAYEMEESCGAVQRFRKACDTLGLETILDETFGGSDLNVFADRGLDGLVLSCAMEQCHSCKENTTVAELCRIAELTLTLMTTDAEMI